VLLGGDLAHPVRVDLADRSGLGRAPVGDDGGDVRGDDEELCLERLGEQGGSRAVITNLESIVDAVAAPAGQSAGTVVVPN